MEALFKQYFWIVKGLGLSVCAALTASVVANYVGSAYIYDTTAEETGTGTETDTDTEGDEDEDDDKPMSSSPFGTPSAGSSTSRPSSGDRTKLVQGIVGHNLFCPLCTKVEAPTDPAGGGLIADLFEGEDELGAIKGGPQPGEVPSTLPYRLVATMEASDPQFSWATLREEETGGAGPYWPGDQIRPGARLISVERRMVHVRNGSQLEYIELGVEPPKSPVKPIADPAKKDEEKGDGEKKDSVGDYIKCESEHVCTVDRTWLEGMLTNPASLAKQARVMPSVKDGETRGFKFYGIRPGSVPKALNLKNGDLVTAVNGIELKSMDGAMALYTKLRRASNLSITIERKGETITKEITIQ